MGDEPSVSDQTRVALVTGGTRGIGTEIARGLAGAELLVHLTGRDRDNAGAALLARETGLTLYPHGIEITDAETVRQLVGAIEAEHGRLDVLVNNAAEALDAEHVALEADPEDVRRMFETNVIAPWRPIRLVVPEMLERQYGRIASVTTGLAQFERMADRRRDDHHPGHGGYRISKVALNALSALVSDELRDSGVLVNASHAGYCRTDLGAAFAPFSVAEGVDVTIHLATIDEDGPTGGWFFQRAPKAW